MDKTPFKVLKNTRSVRTGTVWLEPRVIHVSSAGHHVTLTLKKKPSSCLLHFMEEVLIIVCRCKFIVSGQEMTNTLCQLIGKGKIYCVSNKVKLGLMNY